jgi:hypothetical protein
MLTSPKDVHIFVETRKLVTAFEAADYAVSQSNKITIAVHATEIQAILSRVALKRKSALSCHRAFKTFRIGQTNK